MDIPVTAMSAVCVPFVYGRMFVQTGVIGSVFTDRIVGSQ
jgi:hypothetical protein